MDHVAADASEIVAPVGEHHGEQHPGMGVHLAGACAAILAAALVVFGLCSGRGPTPAAAENLTRRLLRPISELGHAAGAGPPRIALCVELR